MPKTRPAYPYAFRQQILDLHRAGRSISERTREFELPAQTIRDWIKQTDLDTGRRQDGLRTEERQELSRLRREIKQLKMECDILSKAAAGFARETEAVPPKSSNS